MTRPRRERRSRRAIAPSRSLRPGRPPGAKPERQIGKRASLASRRRRLGPPQEGRRRGAQAPGFPAPSASARAGARFLLPSPGVLHVLAATTLLLTVADHWTTWLCLRAPIPGWEVTEANPLADWLFATVGLVPGLVLDTALTVAALAFLVGTGWVPRAGKLALFGAAVVWTAVAVVNNFGAISAMGLSPWGPA